MKFVLALALLLALPVHAGVLEKSPQRAADQAARDGVPTVTVWIGATWGFRNQGAANDLTDAHKAFARHGYKVVDVAPYIEDGDLKGFFVTYQKP